MRFGLLTVVVSCFCLAWGCQNTGGSQNERTSLARIIIGFDETVNPPGDDELLSRLGSELGCELEPLREIGGNAWVYNCPTAHSEELLTRKLDGLARHKGIRYAEIDRKRRIRN